MGRKVGEAVQLWALAIREKVNLKKKSIPKTLKVFECFSGKEGKISLLKYPKVNEQVISLPSPGTTDLLKPSSSGVLKRP